MAVWICLNFTKPRAPTNNSIRVSITNIRLAMSSPDVQQHPAVDPMSVARLLPEECGRVVLRPDRDEAVVPAQTPASGVPVHTAADVAREERLRFGNAERLLREYAQAANAARDVRHDRRSVRRRHNQVAAVVEKIRRLQIRHAAGQRQILREADRAADLALDADEPVEVDGDRAAKLIVAEARTFRVGP